MKCTIPEISWHNRDPVLTADIQRCAPNSNSYRLATGGTDTHVLVWQLSILENGAVSVEMLSDLTRHNRAVNVVRFSPDGNLLASADDEAAIILWRCLEKNKDDIFMDENEKENKENWTQFKVLRSHIEDVYDLNWSECSQFLVSGSVDNSAILWDINKLKNIAIFNDHKGFVQGVAWDPKGQYVASLCSDRCMRIFNVQTKKVVCKTQRSTITHNSTEENQKPTHLFYDDTLKSFCRRLSFSPDGEFIVAPSGILESADGKYENVTHLFSRTLLNRPIVSYPSQDKFTIAVRFCPLLFELRTNNADETDGYTNLFNLPYRMVFAVATQSSVLIYDTQQPIPFAKIANIHYTRLSDLSWSSDGRLLVISSTDGYCSLVSFSAGELGSPYCQSPESTKSCAASDTPNSNSVSSENSTKIQDVTMEDSVPAVPESKKTVSSKKRLPFSTLSNSSPRKTIPENDVPKIATPIQVKRNSSGKPGKRVQLITLSSKVEEMPSTSGVSKLDSSNKVLSPAKVVEIKESKTSQQQNSPSQALKQGPKTPRRVSLITLSSPKSNKKLPKEIS